MRRLRRFRLLLPALLAGAAPLAAQRPGSPSAPRSAPLPAEPRVIRSDLPLPPALRAAYAAGTRSPTGAPGPRYWQQTVDYSIDAELDPATAILRGREAVTVHNTSPDTLRSVVLRLYQNLFRPDVNRDDYVTAVTEGMVVDSLSVEGARVPLEGESFQVEGTIATLTLPRPAAPGADVHLRVAWHFEVPDVPRGQRGERMGRWGHSLFQVAQWYPQVAVYDDLHGWRDDPYLGRAEFYNPFGAFDVRVTLPAGWLIGATGTLQNPEQVLPPVVRSRLADAMRLDTVVHVVGPAERGAGRATLGAPGQRLTWRFAAPKVNDFAFMASDSVVWDATHAHAPDPVALHFLYLPEHRAFRDAPAVARYALKHHARLVMPYAFPQATDVDGPEGGMEYPMIVFSSPDFGTLTHELGHEWFPMMVGSNETWYGWMDEGVNEYVDAFAQADSMRRPVDFSRAGQGYRRIAGTEREPSLMWPTQWAGPLFGVQAYVKAPLALHALGAVVGDSAVQRALSAYAREWSFKHPSPWDLFNSFNRSLGQDLDWFWYPWFFTTETFDQAVAGVETAGGVARVRVVDHGGMPMPVLLRVEFSDGTSTLVTRPVTLWEDGARQAVVEVPTGGRRVTRVTVDPENRFQDVVPGDNAWSG